MLEAITILSALSVATYLVWLSAATPAYTPVRAKRTGRNTPRRRIRSR